MNEEMKTLVSGTIDKEGFTYVPQDMADILLEGNNRGYVVVTNAIPKLIQPDCKEYYTGISMFSLSAFCLVEENFRITKSFTKMQRKSIKRTVFDPAQKCFLWDARRIKIPYVFRCNHGIDSDIWFIRFENRFEIVSRPIIKHPNLNYVH